MWTYTTGGSVTSSPIQAPDGSVYAGSDDNVFYAFSSIGGIKWTYITDGDIYASPAIDSVGNVYIGSEDKQLYAFNSAGGLRWSYTHPGGSMEDRWESSPVIDSAGAICMQARSSLAVFDSVGLLSWSFSTGTASTAHSSSPSIDNDGRIFWGTGDIDRLYAVKSDCTFDWSYRMGDAVESSPAVGSDGKILIGCYDNNLYAFMSAGALFWSYLTVGDVHSSPAVDVSENIYVGSRDNRFYVFTSMGALSWSYAVGMDIDSSPAIDVLGTVYVGAQDNELYAFNSNGTLAWTYKASKSINSSPAIGSGGRLFAGSNDNNIYAIGPASVTYTLYGDEDPGLVSWIAVPFSNAGIDTTEELGNLIVALFTFETDDDIVIERKIGSTQDTETTVGTYNGMEW